MAATARKFETEPPMHEQTVLEVTVNHLQEDVTGLKASVQRLDGKVDSVIASLTEHRLETEKSFGKVRGELKDSIASLRGELKESIASLRVETKESIAALRVEMKDSFAKLRSSQMSQIAWMVSTLIAAAGVAFTVAKFFAAP